MAKSTVSGSVSQKTIHILLVGASGVFGSRLTELLAQERGIDLTLAGRRLEPLKALIQKYPGSKSKILDRDKATEADLAPFDLIIDAAGPFQQSRCNLIEAAIVARCHYVDLADGREFVANIHQFDEAARSANIAIITGASSVPALSHAVVDDLTRGWQEITDIRIGIFPGNRAPRGQAVVEAILSYSGKPVRVFRDGGWQSLPGWGMTHRIDIPGIGKRWASICDTPDQDLLVERYKPTNSAEFFAGLELSILHLGLLALSLPVRWGIIPSLRPAAGIMLWLAQRFLPFGSDRGAMDVQIGGVDAQGDKANRRWVLQADANRGPYVPTLAAWALACHLRDGNFPWRGAIPCAGILRLEDFNPQFDALQMQRDLTVR